VKIHYFEDTDTLFLDLNEGAAASCVDFNDDVLLDLDDAGNVVSITVEHASKIANLSRILTNIAAEQERGVPAPAARPAGSR
jgi:uncharacterized protein YuzE